KDAMPYDEFVASIDHDKERIEDAHNQFRSLYQGGYGASSHEGTGMFNSFEYTAENGVDSIQVAAPFEWAMENAQHILRDNYELLDGASLNLVHSNLTNDNFDGILDELQFRAKLFQETQQNVAHLFGIENSQVWDLVKIESNAVSPKYHLENNLLPMAEMTKQQAFEYVSVYQQWSKAVDLREVNQEKGLDTSTLDEHIAELRSSLDNKLQAARQQSPVLHDMNRLPEKQEQAMKSSQEILAEVIGKYKNHIDSQDGLMNRPLHWLSAAELEDRRTVLSYRIDKVIQNRESRDKLHQLNGEYRNVENEMARRKTLSDNLKEVLESQSETLSVRDFVVLSESFDELLRQINKYDENSAIRETMRQELVAIRARMDGWKQPETLSIDDKLAMTEQKLRKINMDIEYSVYHYGANDKTVQNHIAYRTELLGDLETLEEQATTQGGVSLDDKNSRHANLFLSATKALLYRDLENAVRWHNHFIEESKEIPVPQSVIDMQTKRIEEYSKKLNEYLYGDERQKYRDMFPEQIEEIKQDFKKMLENLETSPENTVKQDAFGLPEKEKNMQDIEQRYNE
ncbi:MAG: hypothetical protein J6W29_04720, partial [Neisseriaceae bacterium]|nr:hypothetical protein [Neisseriaceae bacterium]